MGASDASDWTSHWSSVVLEGPSNQTLDNLLNYLTPLAVDFQQRFDFVDLRYGDRWRTRMAEGYLEWRR